MVQKRRHVVVFMSALTLSVGCTTEEDPDTSCTKDFDCPVGSVCGEETEGERACRDANADEERVFGEITLDVAGDPDEKHLLVVYAVPTDAEAANEVTEFALSGVDAASSGLTSTRAVRDRGVVPEHWRARLQFEKRRRERLDDLITDLNNGRITLARGTPRQGSGCATPCDNTAMCWQGSCVSADIDVVFGPDGSTVTCDLAAVVEVGGTTINVLLDQNEAGAETQAQSIVEDFASTLELELSLLGQTGHTGALDRDEDGRMTVVFTNYEGGGVDASVVGFFDFTDFLSGTMGSGNESDLLWSRLPADGEEAHAVGTLAHEFTHLVSYASRVHSRGNEALREVLWLDEGLAHFMEDLSGWGGSNVEVVQFALENWADAGFAWGSVSADEELVLRGQAYLLLRHMADQAGSGDAASTATENAAVSLFSGLLDEEALGYQHGAFQSAGPGSVADFLQGVYASGRDDLLTGASSKNFLPTGTHRITGNVVGIATHGSFDTARGDVVDLEGPLVNTDLTEVPADDVVPLSGSGYYELIDLEPGTMTFEARGPADVDLHAFTVRVQ